LQARAEARAVAEVQVFKGDPLAWLLCGPGRERIGEPGWSRTATVNLAPSEPVEIRVVYVKIL
jgi:hypothetical protein